VDPIHPIAPGPPAIRRNGTAPVQRLERISRERDRPSAEEQERKRRRPPGETPERDGAKHDGQDGEHRHIDVRV
jgi:hypothetical protein